MIRPLGYWWRLRAAQRQEQRRKIKRFWRGEEVIQRRLTMMMVARDDGASIRQLCDEFGFTAPQIVVLLAIAREHHERGLLYA